MSLDAARGIAYLSYIDSGKPVATKVPLGTVMLVDLNVAAPRVRAALAAEPPDFRPAGLSLYVSPEGARRLFVIDRGINAPGTVIVFEQGSTGSFEMVRTVSDSLLTDASALVAVGPEQFYFTSESGRRGVFAHLLELLGRPSSSAITYYDGHRMAAAAAGQAKASALQRNADGTFAATHHQRQLIGSSVQHQLLLCESPAK
ncbi:MAG: hypothetical protein ABI885_12585 [Gammaproteobacteria bacterium]